MENRVNVSAIIIKSRSFEKTAHALSGKTILIYGAGGFGIEMLRHLRQADLSTAAVLDQRAAELSSLEGVPVYTAEEAPFDRSGCVVLFSIVMDREARRRTIAHLRDLGYAEIVEAQSLRCLLVQPDDRGEESISDYYRRRTANIRRAEGLFTDERSLGVYRSCVFAHATGDYSACAQWESPMAEQYFPPDVPLEKGYQRFLDCGGYTGDTVAQVLEQERAIEACAVFEPDSGNYARMVGRLAGLKARIGQRWLFPCAVSDGAGICGFSQGTGSGALSRQGDCAVETVALDQAVPDFRPTFLKMDIEGAEPAALRGAKGIIARNRPDLAICVYHAVNHIWDIPLLLDSWNLGYRFFLRSYNAYTMETVLYATAVHQTR